MAKGKDRDTSLRGPLCAGEAFELEAAGPRGLSLVVRVATQKRGHVWIFVCVWGVIFVLSVEGSGHHRRAFDTSTVKIPGRLLARSIAG